MSSKRTTFHVQHLTEQAAKPGSNLKLHKGLAIGLVCGTSALSIATLLQHLSTHLVIIPSPGRIVVK